jgi:hypothetical protein
MVLGLLLFQHPPSAAQLSRGGRPAEEGLQGLSFQWVSLEDARVEDFLLQDRADALRGIKQQRIARDITVSLDPERDGTWTRLPDGRRIWRLGIRGEGARALGIVFNRYLLEDRARLYLYDPLKKKVLGAYTRDNNKSSGILPVSYLPGEELILQLEVPAGLLDYGELRVGSVRYAYLPVPDGKSLADFYFGRADTCNVDVSCPEVAYWQELGRSVVRMINNELCTGVLINNTAVDGKPYVYTAAHCVFDRSSGKYQPTVFYFNYASPFCEGPDGNAGYSIAGATLVATGDTSENPRDADSLDFALLELSVAPPDSFQPYFAGWNRSRTPAQNTAAIHHPRGDVKKTSRDFDPPDSNYHAADFFPELIRHSLWRVLEWDIGTTEGGSSGGPLFDPYMRIVGTLTGGVANCVNPVNDYYTRFDYAWDYYDAPAKQLKHWLDPGGTGTLTLNGYDPLAAAGTNRREEPGCRIWPNPAGEFLQVETGRSSPGMTELSIYHISGSLLLRARVPGCGTHTLDVRSLEPGIYILRIRMDREALNQRFVIAR